jgi:outer membrane protein assembly factor BamB
MRIKYRRKKKMSKNKIATLIALILMFAMVVSLVALPTTHAQLTKKTYPFIGAMPNPVGVGQETLLHFGISDAIAHTEEYQHEGWFDLTVTVTRPDGNTETLGPFTTDTTGGTGTQYVPTMAGTYYLQVHFPEQTMRVTSSGIPEGTIMLASDSEKLALNVTDEPRQYYPGVPLPTEYWTRPINAQFREWGQISSNWLMTPYNRFAPYNDAPETPHLLWEKTLAEGGLAGGGLGEETDWGKDQLGYEMGDAYEGKFIGSVILDGVLYFNRQIALSLPQSSNTLPEDMVSAMDVNPPEQRVVAVDLKTGEELWDKVLGDNDMVGWGQTMYWKTMNMYGAFSYLWTSVGTTMKAYDPLTGRWEYTVTDVPGLSARFGRPNILFGGNGEMLIYTVDTTHGSMMMWNSTRVVHQTYYDLYMASDSESVRANAAYYSERWRPQGFTFNGTKGIQWTVPIPTGLPGSASVYFPEDRVIGGYINSTGRLDVQPIAMWGLSLKPGQEGTLLFSTTWQPPAGSLDLRFAAASAEDGVFTVRAKEICAFFGFSMDTGKYLWGPTESRGYMDLFMGGPSGENGMIAYGKLYLGTLAGVLQAIDVKTGELLWTYEMTQPYTELMWGMGYWPIEFAFISDGKVYLLHTEHSGNSPLPRGAPFVCLNATTGEEIFRVDGLFRFTVWGGDPMIADSTAVIFSTYDNTIYAVGKGPSATTVTASPKVSVNGDNVLVEGLVTDISPGTEEYARTARFPNGVPAVSDEDIGEWMKYVYIQFPRPTDVTGVEVVISVLDPNNNFYEVGRATSDASGFYSCEFAPIVPGKYTVVASFEGSEAYYGSFAETAVSVKEAPAATPEPTPTQTSTADLYLVPGIMGIIVAIAVVGALIMLMLRKR